MLVEALTGIRTTDDYDSHDRGYERVVAVKTHYPVKDARRRFKGLDEEYFGGKSGDGRAMVILRNPLNAIPSYFNLQYGKLQMCIFGGLGVRWGWTQHVHFFILIFCTHLMSANLDMLCLFRLF